MYSPLRKALKTFHAIAQPLLFISIQLHYDFVQKSSNTGKAFTVFFTEFMEQRQPFQKRNCLNILNLKEIFMKKMALKLPAFVLYLSGKAFPSILQHLTLSIAPALFYITTGSHAASSTSFGDFKSPEIITALLPRC